MTQLPPAHTSRTWAWTLLLLVLLAARLPALTRPAGGDQSLYTYEGQRVAHGGVPYRDAWDQKPPGIMFVYATGWRLWPRDSMVALLDLSAAALVAVLLVHLGRRTFGGRVGEGAAAVFLLLGDPGIQRLGGTYLRAQCETFIALAVTAALALAWQSIDRRRLLVLAGVWIAVAFWLKYNAIVYALPVGLAALLPTGGEPSWRRAATALGWIAAGAVGASGLVLIYFAASGALTDLWIATVSYNVRYSGETYGGPIDVFRYLVLMPVGRARVDGLWFVGLLGLLLLLAFRRGSRTTRVVLAWIVASVLSIAINGSRGLPQYFLQASPALALAGAAGLAAAWQERARARAVTAIAAVVLAAGAWRVGVEGPWSRPRLFGLAQGVDNTLTDVRYVRGRVTREAYLSRFDRGDGGKFSPLAVEQLATRIRQTTTSADPIFVFGFAAGGVLARSERVSSSRFFWSRPVVLEFAADRPDYGSMGLLADLHHAPPALVALQKHDWGLAEATTPDSMDFFMSHDALRAWLEAGYVRDYEDAVFSVWRRKG